MKQAYTTNDLIRFLYQETNASETLSIGEAIAEDPHLANEYETLLEGFQALPKAQFSPSAATLQNIMGYWEATNPVSQC